MANRLPLQPELPLWGVGDDVPAAGDDARRVLIGDRYLPYALRRGRRRGIGLTVDGSGLRVGAPPRASIRDIEAAIQEHAGWVLKKLDEWLHRPRRPTLAIRDGACVPVLGDNLPLVVRAGAARGRLVESGIHLQTKDPAKAAELLERTLRAHAREVFGGRLAHYAQTMGLAVPPLSIGAARTRWGSCNRATGIRLNWRLIHLPLDLVDYVVVHELAHLKQMNHSPRFWREVEAVLPDYRERRQVLRERGEGLPVLI